MSGLGHSAVASQPCTSGHITSGYLVSLRFAQILALLGTSDTRQSLSEIPISEKILQSGAAEND